MCTVALIASDLGKVISQRKLVDNHSHARSLLPQIDEMLREANRSPDALGGIVVGIGPGTFTGVRVTLAAARALALSLAIPVLGISTLAGLAAKAAAVRQRGEEATLIVPVIDAKRGQVFYGLYERQKMKRGLPPCWLRRSPFSVCDRGDLFALLEKEVSKLRASMVAPVALPKTTVHLETNSQSETSITVDAGEEYSLAPNYIANPSLDDTTDGVERRLNSWEPSPFVVVVGEEDLLKKPFAHNMQFFAAEMCAETLFLGQEYLVEPGLYPEGDRLKPWLLEQITRKLTPSPGVIESTNTLMPGFPGSPESVKPIYLRDPDANTHITKMRDPWATKGGET